MDSSCSISRSTSPITGAYPSTTWSRMAHRAAALPASSSSGRRSSRSRAPRSSLATPCRTVMTKPGPRKTLISPKSISSRSSSYLAVRRITSCTSSSNCSTLGRRWNSRASSTASSCRPKVSRISASSSGLGSKVPTQTKVSGPRRAAASVSDIASSWSRCPSRYTAQSTITGPPGCPGGAGSDDGHRAANRRMRYPRLVAANRSRADRRLRGTLLGLPETAAGNMMAVGGQPTPLG